MMLYLIEYKNIGDTQVALIKAKSASSAIDIVESKLKATNTTQNPESHILSCERFFIAWSNLNV